MFVGHRGPRVPRRGFRAHVRSSLSNPFRVIVDEQRLSRYESDGIEAFKRTKVITLLNCDRRTSDLYDWLPVALVKRKQTNGS